MPQLLVSVRDVEEAELALEGGASLIDIKEPRHGSLGAADAVHWQHVVRYVKGRVPVSVALGELDDDAMTDRIRALPPAITFAKIGLARCRSVGNWTDRWRTAVRSFPPGVSPVGVAYLDSEAADAPPPEQVVRVAAQLGCRAMLWDTFGKSKGHLLDCISPALLSRLVQQARQHHMLVVLAGSIGEQQLPRIITFAPDYIAVRGSVCRGERTGTIDRDLVQRLANRLVSLIKEPDTSAGRSLPTEP